MSTPDPARPTNRLLSERSPYLLQHARNPVAWLPWGDEAFALAKSQDKPVFLSIGYSACHWCHVMERESFEDDATARALNDGFVCVKVDREERPDVDQVYQLAHQVLSRRSGGWPLSMFLTSDREPFYGGTYFPPVRRHGMPAFREVLGGVLEAWNQRRGDVTTQARELTQVLHQMQERPRGAATELPTESVLHVASAAILRRAEPTYGGFGRAPKFPNTMSLDLLFLAGESAGREHVLLSLGAMARGGIRDHLGGGFARYSTDERWLIPHFEKMLYDNALLARSYLDAWRVLGATASPHLTRARCEEVLEGLFGWLAREMTHPETGAFYSAQDADSEGEEGRFFVWTPAELNTVLGETDGPLVARFFGVTEEGNFEHGRSALWTPREVDAVHAELGVSAVELEAAVARARATLFEAREKRPRPLTDDKCLASWNALTIAALAACGATLARPAWLAAARRAMEAWQTRALRDGRLCHALKHTEAYGAGYLDDHAGLACAALELYEATFDPEYLALARTLGETTVAHFRDAEGGGFFHTPADAEQVLFRSQDLHDHAYPGGVGLAAAMLLRLATLTGDPRWNTFAEALLLPWLTLVRDNPMAAPTLIHALDRLARGSVEVVILGDLARDDTRAFVHAARVAFVPHRVLLVVPSAEAGVRAGIDPCLVEGRKAGPDGSPRAWLCRRGVCEAPAESLAAFEAALARMGTV